MKKNNGKNSFHERLQLQGNIFQCSICQVNDSGSTFCQHFVMTK
uniref:Uncharacterized protein n=1 Tax=Tetranychus urticae TaxID=32264 RepID=T1KZB3_TETUR